VYTSPDGDSLYVYRMTKGSPSVESFYREFTQDGRTLRSVDVYFRDTLNGTVFMMRKDENTGNMSMEYFYKTEDGGETWQKVWLDSTSASTAEVINYRYGFSHALLITESVGIIYYYHPDHYIAFLTEDGGRTWFSLTDLPFPRIGADTFTSLELLLDFRYSNGRYYLKTGNTYSGIDYSIEFVSEDLRNWKVNDVMISSSYVTFAAYSEVVDCYRRTAELYSEDGADGWSFDIWYAKLSLPVGYYYESIFSDIYRVTVNTKGAISTLGYSVKDLNSDGIEELIILDSEYTVYAIYTTVNGKIKQVGSYGKNNNIASIDAAGNIYYSGYGKTSATEWIGRLGKNGEIEMFYRATEIEDESGSEDEVRYEILMNGEMKELRQYEAPEYKEYKKPYQSIFLDLRENTKKAGLKIFYMSDTGWMPKG